MRMLSRAELSSHKWCLIDFWINTLQTSLAKIGVSTPVVWWIDNIFNVTFCNVNKNSKYYFTFCLFVFTTWLCFDSVHQLIDKKTRDRAPSQCTFDSSSLHLWPPARNKKTKRDIMNTWNSCIRNEVWNNFSVNNPCSYGRHLNSSERKAR